MSEAVLRALASGDRGPAVLPACRLESGNVDAFGGEAVSDAFRRAPVAGVADATAITARLSLALFTPGEAVFADLYGAHLGRIWRVGQPDPGTPEAAVAVAFDPDLRQARGDVLFEAGDHPELAPDAAARVLSAGRSISDPATVFRARVFVIRAFGDASRGAALFAVHALAPAPVRTPSLSLAAARWDDDNLHIVRDPPGNRALHVRIAG